MKRILILTLSLGILFTCSQIVYPQEHNEESHEHEQAVEQDHSEDTHEQVHQEASHEAEHATVEDGSIKFSGIDIATVEWVKKGSYIYFPYFTFIEKNSDRYTKAQTEKLQAVLSEDLPKEIDDLLDKLIKTTSSLLSIEGANDFERLKIRSDASKILEELKSK